MQKQIRPHKIMLSFDNIGKFKDGILMYQILNENGNLSQKYNSIKINSEMNIPVVNGIIQKAINFVEKQEGISDD